jgi:hypothetical protein
MAERAHVIVPVLRHRETKLRLELALLVRARAKAKAELLAIDEAITALDERLRTAHGARYSDGPRTVAAVTELESHARTLHDTREQVVALKARAQQTLQEATTRQEQAAQEWRRGEVRLGHAEMLARRERIARVINACELEEELQAEGRLARTDSAVVMTPAGESAL